MLKELHLKGVGPAPQFDVEFADRLNIFTGDNGLGKTFLLDIVWWSLTGTWAGNPTLPQQVEGEDPYISFDLDRDSIDSDWEFMQYLTPTSDLNFSKITSVFRWDYQSWSFFSMPGLLSPKPPLLRNLVIYICVDGGFSVTAPGRINSQKAYHFTPDTLWNGLKTSDGKVVCNGLIHDWMKWQYQPEQSTFQLLSRVIRKLSPHASERMETGEPTRVSIEDVRDIPTIRMPYGDVPVTHASAGVKRILGIAYLLVWIWYEHLQISKLRKRSPVEQIILLIDEVESHLHPRWQRSLLPAVLEVATGLQQEKQMKVQVLATTHSPLVLASVEPIFDEEQDRLFHFELQGQEVTLNEVPWAKQGDTVGWLTSEIFGLKQARSKEAEIAIEAAEAWMRGDSMNDFPENLRTQLQIQQELERLLPGHDPFWPRWIVTAEKRRA